MSKKQYNLWNNGICEITGKKWECFDTDSQGGRMYKSRKDETTYYVDIDSNADGMACHLGTILPKFLRRLLFGKYE